MILLLGHFRRQKFPSSDIISLIFFKTNRCNYITFHRGGNYNVKYGVTGLRKFPYKIRVNGSSKLPNVWDKIYHSSLRLPFPRSAIISAILKVITTHCPKSFSNTSGTAKFIQVAATIPSSAILKIVRALYTRYKRYKLIFFTSLTIK